MKKVDVLHKLEEEPYVLGRIELLVFVGIILFLVMCIMDGYRIRFHGSAIKSILRGIDSASDRIVLYLLGAMQTATAISSSGSQQGPAPAPGPGPSMQNATAIAPSGSQQELSAQEHLVFNQLFLVWAITLVSFRSSTDYISGYGLPDRTQQLREARNIIKYLGVAYLFQTAGSDFMVQLWSLFFLLALKSIYRCGAHGGAIASIWLGRSSELVVEYMRGISKKEEDVDPRLMKGYKYLLRGESKQKIRHRIPQYDLRLDVTREDSMVTLDKIWQCDRSVLDFSNKKGVSFRDHCLAFSLFRLLRCRLEGMALDKDSVSMTARLLRARIGDVSTGLALFGIMELEIEFMKDYFYTRFPIVFWGGLLSLMVSLALPFLTVLTALWLAFAVGLGYQPQEGETVHRVGGCNVSVVMTEILMGLFVFKELWEMVTYVLSSWTRLLLACKYVQLSCMKHGVMEKLVRSVLTSNIADPWHGKVDQYELLQSFSYKPSMWNLMSTFGLVQEKTDGAKPGRAIKVPRCVKQAILNTVRKLDLSESGSRLKKDIPSTHQLDNYRWAFELPTCSHVILVWHIATSFCGIQLAIDHPAVNSCTCGLLCSIWPCSKECCSSDPLAVNDKDLSSEHWESYQVANSLSSYCAYLLSCKPDLLPDSFLTPSLIFGEAVKHARKLLANCDSLYSRHEKLKEVARVAASRGKRKLEANIVEQGAMLALDIISARSEAQRWKILADVWAALLVHIAPTWNAAAHKEYLEAGGEFITHIWALLWHCGIRKSSLWAHEDASENNAQTHQGNNAAANNVQPAAETQDPRPYNEAETNVQENHQENIAGSGTNVVQPAAETHNARPYDEAQIKVQENQQPCSVVRGMENLGNRCYFNAALQSLLALDNLRVRLLGLGSDALKGSLAPQLKKLFEATNNPSDKDPLVPEELFKIMCSLNPDFKPGVMEDSNTMITSLTDGLRNQEPGIFDSLLYGYYAKHVSCTACGYTSDTTNHLTLSLPIPSKKHVSLEDCLVLYATGEIEWPCEKCSAAAAAVARHFSSKQSDETFSGDDQTTDVSDSETQQKEQPSHPTKKQTSTQNQDKLNTSTRQMGQSLKEEKKIKKDVITKFHITTAPPILTIQLMRFSMDNGGRASKLIQHVRFPMTLDIRNFMSPGPRAENEDYKYCLVAVIVHVGKQLHEGHNFAYVRASRIGSKQESGDTQSWFRANDKHIEKVDLEEVLKCQAYILFYEKRQEQSKVRKHICRLINDMKTG